MWRCGCSLVAVLLLVSLGGAPNFLGSAPAPPTEASSAERTVAPLSSDGSCPGTPAPDLATGTLQVVGGPDPLPSPGGASVTYSADVEREVDDHGSLSYTCEELEGGGGQTVAENATLATYSVTFQLPSDSCAQGICVAYTGPFAPVSVAVGPPAPGYLLQGNAPDFQWVYPLATVVPMGGVASVELSVGATHLLVMDAETAEGAPSPISLSSLNFTYELAAMASGWEVDNGSYVVGGPRAEVEANAPAGSATLSITASGTYDGTTVQSGVSTVHVTSLATTAGTLTPTSPQVHSGQPSTLTVSDVEGASGYPYNATIWPEGLGAANVSTTCAPQGSAPPAVLLTCSVNWTYLNTGTAPFSLQPVAEVTNGLSSTGPFASSSPVTVYPGMGLAIAPLPPSVTTNSTLDVSGTVSAGVPPYRFCLSGLGGNVQCTPASGQTSPTASFAQTFGSTGPVGLTFSASDGTGENLTVPLSLQVVSPLRLGPMQASNRTLDQGRSVTLSAVVSGGDPPYSAWWNGSAGLVLCPPTTAAVPGSLRCTFLPSWSGWGDAQLTLRDSIGEVALRNLTLDVVPGPYSLQVDAHAGNEVGNATSPLEDDVGIPTDLNATFLGGVAPYICAWTSSGVVVTQGSSMTGTFNGTTSWAVPGNFTLDLQVVDADGATLNGTILVQVGSPPGQVVLRAAFDPVDVGVADNLSATWAGGVAPFHLTWENGEGSSSASTVPWEMASWPNAGNVTLRVTVEDAAGATALATLPLQVYPALLVPCAPSAGPDPTEVSVPVLFDLTCVAGGTPSFSFTWEFSDGSSATTTSSTVSHAFPASPGGSTYVVVSDAGGGRVVSPGVNVLVEPRLRVSIPVPASGTCPLGSDLDPVDAGLAFPLCALTTGGLGGTTFAWSEDGAPLPSSLCLLPVAGTYNLSVVANDSLGATAIASVDLVAVPGPVVAVAGSASSMDEGETLDLLATGSRGTGDPGGWTYRWALGGVPVGTERELNYTFGPSTGGPGPYTFSVSAQDAQGDVTIGTFNATLNEDPSAQLVLGATTVDLRSNETATATVIGGLAPFTYAWAILAPYGWTRFPDGPSVSLPTQEAGSYMVFVNLTDASGWAAASATAVYSVEPEIQAIFWASPSATGGAVVVGGTVTLSACWEAGGTGPYEVGFDANGSRVTSWTPLQGGGTCGSLTTAYSTPGEAWAAAGVLDAEGQEDSAILSFLVVAPAAPPVVTGSLVAHVGAPGSVSDSDAAPYTALSWSVPNASGLAPRTLPNGSLQIDPSRPGAFSLEATAQVEVGGVDLGPTATTTATLVVLAGAAASIAIVLSDLSARLVVGSNLSVQGEAYDANGDPVLDFGENVSLTVEGPGAATATLDYLDPSGSSVGVRSADGRFLVPAAAWVEGVLSLTITQAEPGTSSYVLSATLSPTVGGTWNATWVADLHDLVLSSPHVWSLSATGNDTLWQVADPFGNPVPGTFLVVSSRFGGSNLTLRSDVLTIGNATWAWVNYTVEGAQGGTVEVFGMFGELVLGPLEVPPTTPAAGGPPPSGALLGNATVPAFLAGALAVGGTVVITRRFPSRRRGRSAPPSRSVRARVPPRKAPQDLRSARSEVATPGSQRGMGRSPEGCESKPTPPPPRFPRERGSPPQG